MTNITDEKRKAGKRKEKYFTVVYILYF